MKAGDVLTAAKNTFERYGDEAYAKSKANSFLRRCGAELEDGPERDVPIEAVKETVYSMLDADSEKIFWANLQEGAK